MIYGKSLAIVPLSIYPNKSFAYLEISTPPPTSLLRKRSIESTSKILTTQGFETDGTSSTVGKCVKHYGSHYKNNNSEKCYCFLLLTYFIWCSHLNDCLSFHFSSKSLFNFPFCHLLIHTLQQHSIFKSC